MISTNKINKVCEGDEIEENINEIENKLVLLVLSDAKDIIIEDFSAADELANHLAINNSFGRDKDCEPTEAYVSDEDVAQLGYILSGVELCDKSRKEVGLPVSNISSNCKIIEKACEDANIEEKKDVVLSTETGKHFSKDGQASDNENESSANENESSASDNENERSASDNETDLTSNNSNIAVLDKEKHNDDNLLVYRSFSKQKERAFQRVINQNDDSSKAMQHPQSSKLLDNTPNVFAIINFNVHNEDGHDHQSSSKETGGVDASQISSGNKTSDGDKKLARVEITEASYEIIGTKNNLGHEVKIEKASTQHECDSGNDSDSDNESSDSADTDKEGSNSSNESFKTKFLNKEKLENNLSTCLEDRNQEDNVSYKKRGLNTLINEQKRTSQLDYQNDEVFNAPQFSQTPNQQQDFNESNVFATFDFNNFTDQQMAPSFCMNPIQEENTLMVNEMQSVGNFLQPSSMDFNQLQKQQIIFNNEYSEIIDQGMNSSFDGFYQTLQQPPTPPKSVSPPQQVIDDDYSEVLRVINAIEWAATTEQGITYVDRGTIPDLEVQIIRNVLDREDSTILKEMGMFFPNDNSLQNDQTAPVYIDNQSTDLEDLMDNSFGYGFPITPPQSVSPPHIEHGIEWSDPQQDFVPIVEQCQTKFPEENGIDFNDLGKIPHSELDIYMGDDHNDFVTDWCDSKQNCASISDNYQTNFSERNVIDASPCDLTFAHHLIRDKCLANNLDRVFRALSPSPKLLCDKDIDGDTAVMIIFCKPINYPNYFENIYGMQEQVLTIKVCCELPLGKATKCKLCQNTDMSKFYTPLSIKNNRGHTVLHCVVMISALEETVNFLLYGISQNQEDVRRIFDDKSRRFFAKCSSKYPLLKRYLQTQDTFRFNLF